MKFIIAALVGAIIGYITNWLAIKMLFRPHNEIRVLGMKVPFTPGLIPKERYRVSKSVGNTIGNHLLTKETLVEAMNGTKMTMHLKVWLNNKLHDIKSAKVFLGDLIKFDKEKVSSFIEKKINEEIYLNTESVLKSEIYNDLKDKMLCKISEYKKTGQFKSIISQQVVNKILIAENMDYELRQVIPETFIISIKKYIQGNKENIAKEIKNMIHKEDTQIKLSSEINRALSSNLSPMMAMFINPESICNKITVSLDNYLEQSSNQEELVKFLDDSINKFLNSEVRDFMNAISKEDKENALKAISNFVAEEFISDETIKGIMNSLNSKYNLFIESKEVKYVITILSKELTEKLFKISLSDIVNNNFEKVEELAFEFVKNIFNKFIENEAADVIETLNIPEIVENKLNSFDVAFAEEIILEIADKELKAITWLGALLGFVMGFLTPILNKIIG